MTSSKYRLSCKLRKGCKTPSTTNHSKVAIWRMTITVTLDCGDGVHCDTVDDFANVVIVHYSHTTPSSEYWQTLARLPKFVDLRVYDLKSASHSARCRLPSVLERVDRSVSGKDLWWARFLSHRCARAFSFVSVSDKTLAPGTMSGGCTLTSCYGLWLEPSDMAIIFGHSRRSCT